MQVLTMICSVLVKSHVNVRYVEIHLERNHASVYNVFVLLVRSLMHALCVEINWEKNLTSVHSNTVYVETSPKKAHTSV